MPGRMEVEGTGAGKDFKLYPGGGREWDWNEPGTRHTPGIRRNELEVHHVRKLADLSKPGRREKPAWMHLMAKRRRKTLIISVLHSVTARSFRAGLSLEKVRASAGPQAAADARARAA